MTPKEKTEELAERFRLNVLDYEGCSINSHISKQCALIAEDFAIGFAEWILEHRAKNILLRNNPTTKELLEIYKKETGL